MSCDICLTPPNYSVTLLRQPHVSRDFWYHALFFCAEVPFFLLDPKTHLASKNSSCQQYLKIFGAVGGSSSDHRKTYHYSLNCLCAFYSNMELEPFQICIKNVIKLIIMRPQAHVRKYDVQPPLMCALVQPRKPAHSAFMRLAQPKLQTESDTDFKLVMQDGTQ